MLPSARRTLLEGLLLTLEGDGSGKANAVATARQVLAGEDKPRMVLNAPRVAAPEVERTIAAVRAQLREAEHKLKCPKCDYVNSASASKCENCGHALGEARKAKFAKLNEGVLNADERKASATIKRKNKDGETEYKYPIPDKDHAKAALSRINQSDLSDAEKAKVRAKAKAKLAEAETRGDYPAGQACNLPHEKMAKRGKRICPNCKKPLKLEEGLFSRKPTHTFDPFQHPRDWRGHFERHLSGLKEGDVTELPNKMRVRALGGAQYRAEKMPSMRSDSVLHPRSSKPVGVKMAVSLAAIEFKRAGKNPSGPARWNPDKKKLSEAGYPGHESLDRSPKKNWVERAGQLPSPIQHMAKDIHEERGLPLDQAIPIAISQAKKLAAKGNQKYVRAVAEWEKLRAKNAAKKVTESVDLEEFWSPKARAAAAESRRTHRHTWVRNDRPYKPGDARMNGTWGGVASSAREFRELTAPRDDDPDHIAAHRSRLRELDDRGTKGFGGAKIGAGDVMEKDIPEAAERLDHLRVHHGRDPVNKKHWTKKLMEAATTATGEDAPAPAKARASADKDKSDKPELESTGKRIMHLQNRLNELGFDVVTDGKFGPKTAEAVKGFQRHAMVKDDGIVGPVTANALKSAPHGEHVRRSNVDEQPVEDAGAQAGSEVSGAGQRAEDADADAKGVTNEQAKTAPAGGADPGVPVLTKGAGVGEKKGDSHVRQVQSSLASAGVDINADGRFGPDTEKKIKGFQRKWGLKPDGLVGEKTRRALAHVAGKNAKLHEAFDLRKRSSGSEFVRAVAREKALRRQLEEGRDLEEFWSPQARLAALRARQGHHRPGVDLHPDWEGRKHGEFPGEGDAGEGERAFVHTEIGTKAFGTVRGGKLVSDDGAPIRGVHAPRRVTDEKGYTARAQREATAAHDAVASGRSRDPGVPWDEEHRRRLREHELREDWAKFDEKRKGEHGIEKAGKGMAHNKANLSLKDMPLGTTFEMNDGAQYKLHKAVNDPFYIVKPLDGGKAKPLHKMFAPAKVGPVAEGYDNPDGAVAPALAAPDEGNDLFGMLSKSVDMAQQAKSQGQKPNFNAASPGGAAPAPVAKLPHEVALDAYLNAGGNDAKVIAALKRQVAEARVGVEQGRDPFELREDWATFDAKRKSRGLGHALRGTFQVRGPGEGDSDPKDGFHADLAKLKHGESMRVPLPEGEMNVTHIGGRGLARRYRVAGGGNHVDPDLRRGTRHVSGTGSAANEMAERVRHAVHADFEHTAHHTGRVLSARPGERVEIHADEGHVGTVHHDGKGTFHAIDRASGKKTTHATADGAVRDLKKHMRADGSKFLKEGDSKIDPIAARSEGEGERTVADELMRDPETAATIKDRIEKFNPDGAMGDLTPDKVAELAAKNPLSATRLTGSEAAERAREIGEKTGKDVVERSLHGPRSPGVGHHVAPQIGDHVTHVIHNVSHHVAPHVDKLPHVVHHMMMARIERERANVRRLEESGDQGELLRARARLRRLVEREKSSP